MKIHNDVKAGDVIELFGVRYLVFKVNDKTFTCLDGYDFDVVEVGRNLTAGFRKVKNCEKVELKEVIEILSKGLERSDIG